jgi:hypothetical protein
MISMTSRMNFSDAEWKMVLASPMLASTAVSLADPNSIWGMIKEGMASARALLEAKNDASANELIKSLVAEMETSKGREQARDALKAELTSKTPAEVKHQALAGLARVNEILSAKAPSDAAAFKKWLMQVAQKVAESSTEGGFMGFGGVKVSDAEKATMAEISKTLDVA